jgi:molecular chaperone DnaJ
VTLCACLPQAGLRSFGPNLGLYHKDFLPCVNFDAVKESKDYYAILRITPPASAAEIKKAYRELALRYHPDKTGNDPYLSIEFAAIKEAYEVLTDPARRESYHQLRWYQKSMGKKNFQEPLTPVTLLKRSLELDRYVSSVDVHRLDREGLLAYINDLLKPESVQMLNAYGDLALNEEIIRVLLHTGEVFGYRNAQILNTLLLGINANEKTVSTLDTYLGKKKRTHLADRFQYWLILIGVILLSLLIFFVSR